MGNLRTLPAKNTSLDHTGSDESTAETQDSECVLIPTSQSSAACVSETEPEITLSPSLSTNSSQKLSKSKAKSRTYMDMATYRKHVGIKPLKPVSLRKSTLEDCFELVTHPKGFVSCHYCAFLQAVTSVCCRCGRSISDHKPIDVNVYSKPYNANSSVDKLSACSFYGTSRKNQKSLSVPGQQRHVSRDAEPQCIELTSDEEDEPKVKRTRNKFQDPTWEGLSSDSDLPSETVEVVDDVIISNEAIETRFDLGKWKEAAIEGPFVVLTSRSVRIGSYRAAPRDRILFFADGIKLEMPILEEANVPSTYQTASLYITRNEILQMQMHLGKTATYIFLIAGPKCASRLRKQLSLNDPSGPYFNPQSGDDQRRYITIIPDSVTEEGKFTLRQLFASAIKELSEFEANQILTKTAPPEVRVFAKYSKPIAATDSTGASKWEAELKSRQDRIVQMTQDQILFKWMDEFSVTTVDYLCLNKEEFLNDSIIDFYIKYLLQTKLNEEEQQKYHAFSSFFFHRLITKPSSKQNPVENDFSLTAAEKRHHRVKSWTRRTDIFTKDFLIIPINENSHWFLAVVCFPGMEGVQRMQDNLLVGAIQRSNSNTVPEKPIWQELASDWSVNDSFHDSFPETDDIFAAAPEHDSRVTKEQEPIKQPCILILDSLAGSSHQTVIRTLRDYLRIEYREKRKDPAAANRLFTKDAMPGACLNVPQQTNFSDCGVYVLQYVESFITQPLEDYRLPPKDLLSWFPSSAVRRKRGEIQQLLLNITRELNPNHSSLTEALKEVTVQEPVDEAGPEIQVQATASLVQIEATQSALLKRQGPLTVSRTNASDD